MGHDVFVSYSHKDKAVADSIVASLEGSGVRCWYAPRDIKPGGDWGEEIVAAIKGASVFLLVFSESANKSQRVLDELNLAISKEVVILPFRIENLEPVGAMQLHLAARHWLDAFDPSWQHHMEKLNNATSSILEGNVKILSTLSEGRKIKTIAKKKTRRFQFLLIAAIVAVIGFTAFFIIPRVLDTVQKPAETEVATQPSLVFETFPPATPSPTRTPIGNLENPIIMMYVPPEDAEFNDIDAAAEEIENLFKQNYEDLKLKLIPSSSMDSIKNALCNGDAHVGILDAITYLQVTQDNCPVEAKLVWTAYDDIKYGGEVIVNASNEEIQSLSDLEGKRLCIPVFESMSGWILPSLEFKANFGDPLTFFSEVIELGSHNKVVEAVYYKECDAGTVYYDARGIIKEEHPDVMDEVVIISKTTYVPQSNITFIAGLDLIIAEKLETFFVSLSSENTNIALISGLSEESATGKLVEINDYYYSDLRDLFERAGENPEDY